MSLSSCWRTSFNGDYKHMSVGTHTHTHTHTHTLRQTQTNSEALNLAAVCFTTQCLACGRAEIVWATTGKLGQEKNYKEVLDLISKIRRETKIPLELYLNNLAFLSPVADCMIYLCLSPHVKCQWTH